MLKQAIAFGLQRESVLYVLQSPAANIALTSLPPLTICSGPDLLVCQDEANRVLASITSHHTGIRIRYAVRIRIKRTLGVLFMT